MMVPTRLLALQRLCSLFLDEDMTINGEPISMEGSVYRGRILMGEETLADELLPVLSIVENPRPDIAEYAGVNMIASNDQWTLLVQGICSDDGPEPGDTAYWFEAAVRERLSKIQAVDGSTGEPKFPTYYMLGNLISSLEISPPVIRPADSRAPSAKAIFFLPLRVGIGGTSDRPYTSVD